MFTEGIMASGIGFGKTILFGEHFVVHGSQALVAGLQHYTKITLTKSLDTKFHFTSNQPRFPGVSPLTLDICKRPFLKILQTINISTPLNINLEGTLPLPHGGIGSSAASCVAFARALNELYNLGWDDKEVNKYAHLGEQEIHGTPSGIDNTASTYGNMFWFKKNGLSEIITPVKFKHPIQIILAESNIRTNTKDVVYAVTKFCQDNPQQKRILFAEYEQLTKEVEQALKTHNLKMLGILMNENHALLQKLTTSCDQLDSMVNFALKHGALGAKLTGTGRGGLMLALAPDEEVQKKLAKAFEAAGYATLSTEIG